MESEYATLRELYEMDPEDVDVLGAIEKPPLLQEVPAHSRKAGEPQDAPFLQREEGEGCFYSYNKAP